jgi:flagellar basal body-associated protein FliL
MREREEMSRKQRHKKKNGVLMAAVILALLGAVALGVSYFMVTISSGKTEGGSGYPPAPPREAGCHVWIYSDSEEEWRCERLQRHYYIDNEGKLREAGE